MNTQSGGNTVKDLKKIIKGLPDAAEVVVFLPNRLGERACTITRDKDKEGYKYLVIQVLPLHPTEIK